MRFDNQMYFQWKPCAEFFTPRAQAAIDEWAAFGFIVSRKYFVARFADSKVLFSSTHNTGFEHGFLAPVCNDIFNLRSIENFFTIRNLFCAMVILDSVSGEMCHQVNPYAREYPFCSREHLAIAVWLAFGCVVSRRNFVAKLADSNFLSNSAQNTGLEFGFLEPIRPDIFNIVSGEAFFPIFAMDMFFRVSSECFTPKQLPALGAMLKYGESRSNQNCSLTIQTSGDANSIGVKRKAFSPYLFQDLCSFELPCLLFLKVCLCCIKRCAIPREVAELPMYTWVVIMLKIKYTPVFIMSFFLDITHKRYGKIYQIFFKYNLTSA